MRLLEHQSKRLLSRLRAEFHALPRVHNSASKRSTRPANWDARSLSLKRKCLSVVAARRVLWCLLMACRQPALQQPECWR